ncbi:crosslink repair DNA glycosylase YcaQ family protein [Nocardioides ginkgobilobae]
MHELTREQARRIAVRAQLLAEPRPSDVLEVVEHLTLLQLDPTKVVVPSAHLVLWSRLGATYERSDLDDALTAGELVEIGGMATPLSQVPLHRAVMAGWPGAGDRPWHADVAGWVEDNDECRREILETLRQEGPSVAPELPNAIVRPWKSSGWTNDKSVLKLLDIMAARGEVVVVGREGQHRLWDLAERVLPDDPVPPIEEATAELRRLRLRSLGIDRGKQAGDAGEPARIEGVRGTWRVDPSYVGAGACTRTVLLSPLDRLVLDRARMAALFDFDYQLEQYKPVDQRRFGYWALPVLHGHDLVGKVDCTAEPGEGVLRVDAVHEDPLGGPDGPPWADDVRAAVHAEIDGLATWLGVEALLMPGVRT